MRYRARTKWHLIALILVLTIGLVACTKVDDPGPNQAQGPDEPTAGGTITVRLNGDVSGLNPFGKTEGNTYQLWAFMAESLVRHTPDNKWTGQLAETWDISPDGKEYTFNLRKDVKWHDGEPFTADDVIFSYELHWDDEVSEEAKYTWMVDDEPITMEKVDAHTVKMILPKPFPAILEEVKWFIPGPKHILENVPRNEIPTCEWGNNPVFTGPFKFVEYKPGEYVKMERFDDYWGGTPYLDAVYFRVLADENAAAVALESGQLDWTRITPAVYDRLKDSSIPTIQSESGRIILVQIGEEGPNPHIFEDLKVRKALSHLIDRENISETVMGGLVKPAYNVMTPSDMYYTEDIVKYGYDVDKAIVLLEEAGWTLDSSDIRTKDGKPFEVELIYQSGDSLLDQSVLLVQNAFQQAGIKLNLRALERTALIQRLIADDYDLIINGNLMGPDPHRYIWIYGERTPELEELFAKGRSEVDTGKRAEIYKEIQNTISELVCNIPLYYPDTLYAHNPKLHVEDAEVHGGVYHFYNTSKIWIEK